MFEQLIKENPIRQNLLKAEIRELFNVKNALERDQRYIQQELNNLRAKRPCVHGLRNNAERERRFAKQLMPIIRAFNVEKGRLVYPDGHRIRLGKVDFRYVEKIKKPDTEWNGIVFSYSSETNIIYYSFRAHPNSKSFNVRRDEARKAYNFHPERFLDGNSDKHYLLEFLRTKTTEEIESIAIYGSQEPQKDYRLEEMIKEKDEENKLALDMINEVKKIINVLNTKDGFYKKMEELKKSELSERRDSFDLLKRRMS